MLSRTLLLAAMAALAYYIYRRWTQARQMQSRAGGGARNKGMHHAMKKCAKCGLHLPQHEALSHGDLYFCSEDHRKLYLQEHQS